MNRAPVPPVRLNREVPPKLEDIINKALEKDRNLRYQSAKDIRTDLQRLQRDTETGRAVAAGSGTIPVAGERLTSGKSAALATIGLVNCYRSNAFIDPEHRGSHLCG